MRKGYKIMNKKVLILHGLGGSSYPHWQAWLASKLIKDNFTVSFPEFPNPDLPDFDVWMETLEKEFNHFQPDIVVCHSLANILWFHFVQKYKNIKNIEKLMLVAPVRQSPIEGVESFFPYPIIKDLKADEVIMVGSTNDPYMSQDEVMDLQYELNVGLKILNKAGHINTDSGFGELSCAVDWVKGEYR